MTEKDRELSRCLVVGHKRDGRCCYDRQAKRELVEASKQPGVSVARMALQQGINANLLRTWIAQYRGGRKAWVIAQDSGKTALARASAFVPVVPVRAPAKAGPLNVGAVLPNGVKLNLSELGVGELSLILKMLSQLPCSASTPG
jgi:transposase